VENPRLKLIYTMKKVRVRRQFDQRMNLILENHKKTGFL